jgi:hypothetical protein
MKMFLCSALAALALGLGLTAGNASAYWGSRTVYRWDPIIGRYVVVTRRYWVPGPRPVVVVPAPAPAPVVVQPVVPRVEVRSYYPVPAPVIIRP